VKSTVLAVGDELTRAGQLGAALDPLGLHLATGGVEDALCDWRSEEPPLAVALGPDVPEPDAEHIKRHLKLSEHLNRVGVLAVLPEGATGGEARGICVEPDVLMNAPASAEALAGKTRELESLLKERAGSGVRFFLQVTMPSDLVLLRRIEEFVETSLGPARLGRKATWAILQSAREIGLNAIEWGNKGRRELPVHFTLILYPDRFCATVADQGEGFDPGDLPHAAEPGDPLGHIALRETCGMRVGGYGILICRELMDEVKYNQIGNEVTLVKYFRKPN